MSQIYDESLRNIVNSVPSVKADLNMILMRLRRRQLSGSHQCTKATFEIVRNLVGRYNFSSGEAMMNAVRACGRELTAAAPAELTIGNLVRRILFIIREEYSALSRAAVVTAAAAGAKGSTVTGYGKGKDRSNSVTSASSVESKESQLSTNSPSQYTTDMNTNNNNNLPERGVNRAISITADPSIPLGAGENVYGGKGSAAAGAAADMTAWASPFLDDFTRNFPGLKPAVISSINELSAEIDNLTPICQRAQDYIHVDECILTYGYSRIVEQFLKAAAAKRRFQVIIAESAPSLDGHQLAAHLSKVTQKNISVTLIPDSNVYALMARVNKVIISPHAVTADGGAICTSGHYMVAAAAKELSVPVVGVAGAFSLTPLFAHNQSSVLSQLLSPADAIPYNVEIDLNKVEVNYYAYEYLPPDLIDLYVTNDGSQLPSFVFRQLSEYYHPQDYLL